MADKDKAGFNSPFGKLAGMVAKPAPKSNAKLSETSTVREAKALLAEREREKQRLIDREKAGIKDTPTPRHPRTKAAKGDKPPSETVSPAEADEFLRAMGNIAPLGKKATLRVEPAKRLVSELPDDDSLALAELQSLVEGDTPFRIVESEELYSGAAPGVSQELVERLREGTFSFRRHVDLHGYTRDDAKTALIDFIASARRDGERCVLVITGRGLGSPGGNAVLREALPRWLGRFPLRSHVLAYCTARSVDGGPGAFYVLLRRLGAT